MGKCTPKVTLKGVFHLGIITAYTLSICSVLPIKGHERDQGRSQI
jgi:hypothetical protein